MDCKLMLSNGGVSRHETFTPRYGWLKKGYEAIKSDNKVFSAKDAIERLGVGKNMVRSMRSWCLAFNILEPMQGENKKGLKGALQATRFGGKLLSNDGWDPFLEDFASLWLLHWQLFVPPFECASWPIAFNHCHLPSFDAKLLSMGIIEASKQYEKLAQLSEGSFEKDASCLIRMYSEKFNDPTSGIYCPFARLNIIREAGVKNFFRFVSTEKNTLNSLIFLACCFSFANITQPNQKTLSLHKIVYDFNSPGIAFKISETHAGRLLEGAVRQINGVDFVNSLGNQQLQFDKPAEILFWEILELYYASNR